MTDYFKLAVGLARAEGQATMQKIAAKTIALQQIASGRAETCGCSAYRFPHRPGSGRCPSPSFLGSMPECKECKFGLMARDPYGVGSDFPSERFRVEFECTAQYGCPWRKDK